MIPAALLLAFFFGAGSPNAHSRYQRPVQVSTTGQNYLAVDESIWAHSRGDLGDVRLFAADTEIPYSIAVERGSLEEERKLLPVLQQSTVAGKTQFLIDMSGLVEYDHVELKLATRNFVAHAQVEGQDDPHGPIWASLGDTILYDLSRENLGSNSTLRLPRATYKFLRVTIDGPVAPRDVESAVSETAQEQPAVWRDVSSSSHQQQTGKDTVITFAVAKTVPVERVTFAVDPSPPNFRRDVEIKNDKEAWLGSGEITRIHMVRAGRKIDSENYSVSFSGIGQTTIKVVIHNGDDRPLQLRDARLQQLERRVYFDASAPGHLTFYYGDEKLDPPLYDYAKLFQRDKAAVLANLGSEAPNALYTERTDDRPWSERHPVVLWIAIIAAVLGLTAIALRSVRTATA